MISYQTSFARRDMEASASSSAPPAAPAISPSAAKRLGIESSKPIREPSPILLFGHWALEQTRRWLRGNLYPHLHAHRAPQATALNVEFASRVARKLATRQDRFHLHKLLGLICLLNFTRHVASLLTRGCFDPADGFLLAHAGLALTSRSFHVTRQADKVSNGHLTEEVRWHALLFSLRNLAFIPLHKLLQRYGIAEAALAPAAFMAIALPFHLAVDKATRVYGEAGWTSIRGHEMQKEYLLPIEVVLRRILSTLQFVNNHALLFGGARRAEIALFGVGWVQINAFCMTLRKKDLISEDGLMHAYALLSVFVTTGCLSLTVNGARSLATGVILLTLRSRGASKYLLWPCALVVGCVDFRFF